MKKVLVIDDDAAVTRSIRAVMNRKTSFTVREVNDARRAHSAALEFAPDVIVLDIDMPYKTGPDVAEELRNDGRTREIPIVFLSSMCTRKEQSLAPGERSGDLLMAKPFQVSAFLRVVRELAEASPRAGRNETRRRTEE
jgi:CheY-like chemotaxis protein